MLTELGLNRFDLYCLIFVFLFCIIGLIKGAIRQFFSIIAFFLASILSILIPYFIKLPYIDKTNPIWTYLIFSTLLWIPAFLIFSSIGKYFANILIKKGVGLSDHFWGFFFGLFKGIIIITIIIFLIDIIPFNLERISPAISEEIKNSRLVTFVEPYNPLLKIHIFDNINIIINSANDPDYMELLNKDPEFRELVAQKSIKAIIDNPELKLILENKQVLKFLTHPDVRNLINDPEALKLLLRADIDKTIIENI